MVNKKLKKHKDVYFNSGFGRYFVIDLILDSNSWKELEEELKKYEMDGFNKICFLEYKLFNLTLSIEYTLSHLLEQFFKANKITNKDSLFRYILKETMKYRKLNESRTTKILNKEIGPNKNNLCSPNVLFYVAGIGLGSLVHIFRTYTESFSNKDNIIKKLQGFNKYRNDAIHNLLSSRINSPKQIIRAIKIGNELNNIFSKMTRVRRGSEGSEIGLTLPTQ